MKALAMILAAWTSVSAASNAATTMTGTWNNTTFGSSGALTTVLEISGSSVTASIDLDGFVFGGPDPAPLVLTGTLDGSGNGTLTSSTSHPGGHATYGDVTGTVTGATAVQLSMENIPSAGILFATIEGTFSPAAPDSTDFAGTYYVGFNETARVQSNAVEGSDYAVGTLAATVPEPSAFALTLLGLAAGTLLRRRNPTA